MTTITHIVFDLDGTLVHTAHLDEILADMAREAGIDEAHIQWVIDHRFHHQAISLTAQELLRVEDTARGEAFTKELWERAGTIPGHPLAGAEDTLRQLHERGISLYLSTGSPPGLLEATLAAHGWQDLFVCALGSEPHCDKGTHHMDLLLEAGLDCARALTVGDGTTEMRLGREQPMPVRVGLAQDEENATRLRDSGATVIVPSVADILRLPGILLGS